jgi:hypothetical protein
MHPISTGENLQSPRQMIAMTNGWQSSKKSIVVLFCKQRGYDAAKK